MSDIGEMTKSYLVARDKAVKREGAAMLRLSKRTGYSVEMLRSIAYGRKAPDRSNECARKLRDAVRRG